MKLIAITALGALLLVGCNQNRDVQERASQAGGPSKSSEYSDDSRTNKNGKSPAFDPSGRGAANSGGGSASGGAAK